MLLSQDARSHSQSSASGVSGKYREYADNLYEASVTLQNTLSQLKRLRKTWECKQLSGNMFGSLRHTQFNTEGPPNLTSNDSFIRRINNQSLLRDVSVGSINPRDDKKRTVCGEVGRILNEG